MANNTSYLPNLLFKSYQGFLLAQIPFQQKHLKVMKRGPSTATKVEKRNLNAFLAYFYMRSHTWVGLFGEHNNKIYVQLH